METKIEIINGEEYKVTIHDSGTIVRELKMSEAQKAIIDKSIAPIKTEDEKIDELTIKMNELLARMSK